MDPTCTTALVNSGLTVESAIIGATQVTVTVSVNFSSLISSVWTDSTTAGTLSFCYRLDANVDGYSVNHVSTIVTATVDLENSMSLSSIDVQDKVANNESVNISIDYPLTTTFCDAQFNEVTTPPNLAPGDAVSICVIYSAGVAGVNIGSVYSAVMSQSGGFSFTRITDGTILQPFTSVDCSTEANTCRITTTVVGAFFTNDSLAVQMSGTALMAIDRRMMEVPIQTSLRRKTTQLTANHRESSIEPPMKSSDFGVELALTHAPTETSSSARRRSALLWSSFIGAAALVAGLV
jgi:hypothetical protein